MIDPKNVPAVGLEEVVARYVLASKASKLVYEDGDAKWQLFCPYRYVELSVNRHLLCSEEEIWQFGRGVAEHQGKTLQGRFDLRAGDCTVDSLSVKATPIPPPNDVPMNPNHADIVGFPETKPDQKVLGLKLADKAGKRIEPPATEVEK